jgi:hypothetical protein
MATNCDGASLVREARCLCIPQGLQLEVLIALNRKLLQYLDPMQACDGESLVRDARCLCIPPGDQLSVLIFLNCKLLQLAEQGGTGGGSGVSCGNVDPVGLPAPTGGCGIYINYVTWTWWQWDPPTAAWVQKLQ